MAKTKIEPSAGLIVLTEDRRLALNDKFRKLELQIQEFVDGLNELAVTDDHSSALVAEKVTMLNAVVKKVEALYKTESAPAKEYIDYAKGLEKRLTEQAKIAVADAKERIMQYDAEELQKRQAAEAIKKQKQAAEDAKKRLFMAGLEDIRVRMASFASEANMEITKATTQEKLTELSQRYYVNFPQWEGFNDPTNPITPEDCNDETNQYMTDFRNKLKENILELGKARRAQIKEGLAADINLVNQANQNIQDLNEELSIGISLADTLNAEDPDEEESGFKSSITYRTDWTFEVVDKSVMPKDWLVVDEAKVKNYLKGLKQMNDNKLYHGNVVNGIRIIEKKTPISNAAPI